MPGVRCEVMCKAWTSVPDVLCEVRSSVSVLCLSCVVLCGVRGSVPDVLREVWSSVLDVLPEI